MKKAYLTLIKNALDKNLTISVHDGGCWEVKRSSKYQEIKECIESVEVAEIRLRDGDNIVGWAQIIPGLDPEETVSDFSYNKLMHELTGFEWDGE
jgi:hypothetical protein